MATGKRTWRRRQFTDDAIRDALRQSKSIAAAARRIGVNKSSLSRWLKDDPALHPSPPDATSTRDVPPAVQPTANMTPEQWKAWVLQTFEADATECQLIDLACTALEMSRDLLLRPADRLAAAARFQALVRQLNFPDPEEAHETETKPNGQPNLYRVK